MKKTILKTALSLTFFAMHLSLSAQFSWFQQFRTDGKDVYTDGTHVWRIGYFDNTTTIGSTTLTSNGNYDVLVTKSDLNGNVVWAKSFGSTKEDRGTALCVDPSGNVYITGLFKEQLTIGSDSYTSGAGYWQPNGYLAKLDVSGSVLWSRHIKCKQDCEGVSLAYDAAGDQVYLAANFLDSLTLGTNQFYGQYYGNTCLAKVTSSGSITWAYGFTSHESRKLRTDAAGNVWLLYGVVGTTAQSYVKKFNPTGDLLSTVQFTGTLMRSLCIDGQSNIWAAGSLIGTTTLGTSTLTAQNWDIVVAKANASGTITFAKNYGGVNSEHGMSLCVDPSDNIYISGNKAWTDNLGTLTSSGSAFFMQLNNAGVEQWLGTIPGTNLLGDQAHGLCSDNAGNIFATGYFEAWAGNPIVVNGTTYIEGGGFFARLNPGGAPVGITEMDLSEGSVYPNPASDVLHIEWKEKISSFKVSSLSGQQFDLELNGTQLNVSALPSGVYFLELQSDETIQRLKFVKK